MSEDHLSDAQRRDFLTKAAKAAVIVPPAMTVLLSTSMSSPAIAASGDAPKGNNGLGNGVDPQPPGDPKPNDVPGV